MQKQFLWILAALVLVVAVGALIFFLVHRPGTVITADEASQIDCGTSRDNSSTFLPCMSAALRICTSAVFYDYNQNPIGGNSYRIMGKQGQYCQIQFQEHAKPPAYFKACNFDMAAITALDNELNHPDTLFDTAILKHESDCTL